MALAQAGEGPSVPAETHKTLCKPGEVMRRLLQGGESTTPTAGTRILVYGLALLF